MITPASPRVRVRAALSVLLGITPLLTIEAQQKNHRTFNFYFENDAFVNSDTGYTNGVRLAWTLGRNDTLVRWATDFGAPWLLQQTRIGKLVGLDIRNTGRTPCIPRNSYRSLALGRCLLLNLGVGQTIYTPNSLITPRLLPRERPYAGFLFANVGGTSLSSPRARDRELENVRQQDHPNDPPVSISRFSFVQLSNSLMLGVVGPKAHSEDTQSLAHWTWSSGSARPRGWHNQLKNSPQAALVTELHVRPHNWELCNAKNLNTGKRLACSGTLDEHRWLDFTPRTELVLGSYMRRASLGTMVRVGSRFPSFVGISRVPTAAPNSVDTLGCHGWRCIVPERYWWNGFAAVDARYVQHNTFIEGGYADSGADGWREQRQIDLRHGMGEGAVGFAFGNSKMTAALQYVWRTPEYAVRNAPHAQGQYRYVSANLAIHTSPGQH